MDTFIRLLCMWTRYTHRNVACVSRKTINRTCSARTYTTLLCFQYFFSNRLYLIKYTKKLYDDRVVLKLDGWKPVFLFAEYHFERGHILISLRQGKHIEYIQRLTIFCVKPWIFGSEYFSNCWINVRVTSIRYILLYVLVTVWFQRSFRKNCTINKCLLFSKHL